MLGVSTFLKLLQNGVCFQCCDMLDYLGVPHIQASGEAEALCAALNQAGVSISVCNRLNYSFVIPNSAHPASTNNTVICVICVICVYCNRWTLS